jgi:2-oxoglutarate dehydrogenase complex dehydrogenase (E1) component-like enzyme
MAGFLSENRPIRTLREILNRLRETYCGNIGFEVRLAFNGCCCIDALHPK